MVIPDVILPKDHEDWRLVSLFFPRALPFKVHRRSLASDDFQIRNGYASLACQGPSANAAVLYMVWWTCSRFETDAHLANA